MSARHRVVLRDNIQGITKNDIKRMARRAGVKRLSGLVYEEVRGVIKTELEELVGQAVIMLEHARRKTMSVADVQHALESLGKKVYFDGGAAKKRSGKRSGATQGAKEGTSGARKPHRYRSGTVALREIRKAQKSTEMMIRRLPFERFVREVAQDFKTDLRFSEGSLELIQVQIEASIVCMLQLAQLQAIHADRTTVDPSDIQIVRRMRSKTACN